MASAFVGSAAVKAFMDALPSTPRIIPYFAAPPVAAQGDVPHVVRDDAIGAFEVDLSVAVHVLDGQRPLTRGIIAEIGEGERNK